ncbi:MAG: hypothetical protein HYZ38_05045 [Mycobacterium sp.]|nr:hypothetical protein [Mycobacterium sp.]
MILPDFGRLYAAQRFQVVNTTENDHVDPDREPFRVSTREYIYRLVMNKGHVIEWHWHPQGNSHERRPHIHPAIDPKAHLPGPRFAMEDVIESCIQLGAKPSREDWAARLLESGGIHKLYRTWVNEPGERQAT